MELPSKYRTTIDPCPECGTAVINIDERPDYVRSNPSALITIPHPDCPHPDDPSADCICSVMSNPYPNPSLDVVRQIANWVTFHPCRHTFEQRQLTELGWKVNHIVKPGWHAEQISMLRADAANCGVVLDD